MYKLVNKSLLFAVAMFAMLINSNPVHAAEFEFTSSAQVMETHPSVVNGSALFQRELSKRSNGLVKITYFNPGTLCATNELFNACEKGVINIINSPMGAFPAQFPIAGAIDLPFIFTNSRSGSLTANYMFENSEQYKKELSKFKVMGFATSHPRQILSVHKPIRTLEDMKGIKMGVNSAQAGDLITALGAVPVILPLNDMYLALQRGMIDACMLQIPAFRSSKVTEVAKFITIANLSPSAAPLLMNLDSWESLPKDVQVEFDKLFGEPATIFYSNVIDKFTDFDLQWIVDNHKAKVYTLDPTEKERWIDVSQSVYKNWAERAKRQKVENPEAFLEELRKVASEYNKPEVQAAILENHKEILGSLYDSLKK